MKRVNRLMPKISEIDNLYLAYLKARRGKRLKKEVLEYARNIDENILHLKTALENGEVEVGQYRYFTIYDPKERVICAARFEERVLHHAIMNVCHEYFDRTLIDTTFATRKGKGVYAALDYARKSLKKYNYVVKLDFRKYYDSVVHEIVYDKLSRMFKDRELLSLFSKILESYEVSEGCGLPIGNLTSQYFANNYLSSLDHMIKEDLRIPAYARYMDDMLLACDSRSELKRAVKAVNDYSTKELQLKLKPPVYRNSENGVEFLGYKVYSHHLELTGRSKKRYREKLLDYEGKRSSGVWSEDEYRRHVEPLVSFTDYAACHAFRASCNRLMGVTS